MKWLWSKVRNEQGQALVEFALILPIFLMIIMEGINVLLMVGARNSVQDVEASVTRWISVGQMSQAAQAAGDAFQEAPGMNSQYTAVLLTYAAGSGNPSNSLYWDDDGTVTKTTNTIDNDCQAISSSHGGAWGCVHVNITPSSSPLTLTVACKSTGGAGTCHGHSCRHGEPGKPGGFSGPGAVTGSPATATVTTHYYNYKLIAPTFGVLASTYSFSVPAQVVPVYELP